MDYVQFFEGDFNWFENLSP